MAAFATGLAAPFFVLALFPSFLQKLPKSGGWLMRVKVVLGFVVLAIAIKYLSTADQILQTDLISREMFLASWVVLFALPGLYLLGFLRLEGIKPDDQLGRRPRAGGGAVPDLLHQPVARTVRRIARQRGSVHSGAGQGAASLGGGRRSRRRRSG